jgi:hypothetical protein
MEYETHILSLIIRPKNEPIFSENATIISLDDEAAGLFVKVKQLSDGLHPDQVRLDTEEWPVLKKAIDQIVSLAEKYNKHDFENLQ